jgi:tungstate transport system substrate-binding protein
MLFYPSFMSVVQAITAQAAIKFIVKACLLALMCTTCWAQPLVIASTTSTEQSGLFGHLLPAFTRATGIQTKVLALGTGQALDVARRGDADVLLVHDKLAEDKFVAEGFGIARFAVMYNDFVVVGPAADPAKAMGRSVSNALQRIAQTDAVFISRGDKSGTHAAELSFWAALPAPNKQGAGYKACGCSMGAALNMAAASPGYTLADRGTWLNFKNRSSLAVLVEGDTRLFNPYGVIAVNPAKHPHVNHRAAQVFVDWITSPAGQGVIASYKIDGQVVFFPQAAEK